MFTISFVTELAHSRSPACWPGCRDTDLAEAVTSRLDQVATADDSTA